MTEGILGVALNAARQAGGGQITAIQLVIGELSSIIDDSVQFYFDVLSKDTPAEGATLHFRREPARASCGGCGHSWPARVPLVPGCPACGSTLLAVTGGREFYVESIELDEEEGTDHESSRCQGDHERQ